MNSTGQHERQRVPVVLLIDDCEDVHRLLKTRLRFEAFEIAASLSGAEGLELVHKIKPAIILLDLDMPEMDGFEVLRRLKDDPEASDIPVLVISGMHSPHDKVTAFDLGAVDYITKPFDLTELRMRVRSAMRMRQLVLMLAQKAQIDGLTGLWNRAYFDRRWSNETSRIKRYDGALSLALLDLDHFKAINDTYGHPAGDEVLQTFAHQMLQEIRQSDVACRYGGEEFAIIMPDTAPEHARTVCERIRVRLEETVWPRHPNRPLTVSVGIVGTSGMTTMTSKRWLEQVDNLLYRAKSEGRNRVCTADVTMRPPRIADAG
ncbi:MAG: diguanylate cyclase [Phycisphaerales bacterium]